MSRVLELCSDLPVRRVLKGETLMSQGGTELHMAVLKEGLVEVVRDGQPIAQLGEPGSVFGEMAVILQSPHTATVRAIETSEFYMIEDPYSFLWERAEFNFELLTILAKRLEEIDQQLAGIKHQSESEVKAVEIVGSMLEKISQRDS